MDRFSPGTCYLPGIYRIYKIKSVYTGVLCQRLVKGIVGNLRCRVIHFPQNCCPRSRARIFNYFYKIRIIPVCRIAPQLSAHNRKRVKKPVKGVILRNSICAGVNIVMPYCKTSAKHLIGTCRQRIRAEIIRLPVVVQILRIQIISVTASASRPAWHHIKRAVQRIDHVVAQIIHRLRIRITCVPYIQLNIFHRNLCRS